MATPPSHHAHSSPPPKTPGWSRGLFGIFSTAKKAKPVESSTKVTDRSSPPQLPAPPTELNFSQPYLNSNDSSAVAEVSMTTGTATGKKVERTAGEQASPHNLDMSARSKKSLVAKSPWKSPGMNGVGLTQKSSSRAALVKKNIPVSARKSFRRRRDTWRPNSTVLVNSKIKRSAIDPSLAVSALERSKGAFAPSRRQTEARQNLASFKVGNRLLGSHQRASRLPPPADPDQPKTTSTNASSKRPKKVSFGMEQAPVVAEVSTPARSELPRKATPFKASAMDDEKSPTSSTSSSVSRAPLLPLTPQPILHATETNVAQPNDIGEPVSGDMRAIVEWAMSKTSGVKISNVLLFPQAQYERSQQEAQKEAEKKSSSNITHNIFVESETEKKVKKSRREQWTCKVNDCGRENSTDTTVCGGCGEGRKQEAGAIVQKGWGNLFKNLNKDRWKCSVCYAFNPIDKTACTACEAEREPGGSAKESAGGSTAQSTLNSKSSSAALNVSSTAGSTTTFQFGGANTSSKGQSGFVFNAAPVGGKSKGGFVFGDTSSVPSKRNVSAAVTGSERDKPSTVAQVNLGSKAQNGEKPVFSFGSSNSSEKADNSHRPKFGLGMIEKPEGTTPKATLGSLKAHAPAPATEPSSKRSRPAVNDGNHQPTSAIKGGEVKPFVFSSSATKVSAPMKEPLSNAVPFGVNSKQQNKISSFGNSNTTVSDTAPKSKPATESKAAPFSFGGVPVGAGGIPVSSSQSDSVAPKVPLGSIPSAASEDRSKRRREGDNSSTATFGATPQTKSPNAPTLPAPAFKFGSTPSSTTGTTMFGSDPASSKGDNGGGASKDLFTSAASNIGSAPSKNSAGTSDTPAPSMPFGNAPTPASGGFSFSKPPASTPSFTFGNSAGSAPQASTGAVTGTGNAPPPGKQAGMFGSTSTPAAASEASSNAGQTFGNAAATSSNPGQAALFGSASAPAGHGSSAQSATNGLFGQAASAANPFGAAPATTPSFSFGAAPAASTPAPVFGSTNTAQTPAPAQPFGSASTAQTPAPAQPFGSANTTQTPAQPFGSTNNAPAQAQPFGSANTAPVANQPFGSAPAAATAPQPFGSAQTAPAPAPGFFGGSSSQTMGSFGASAPAPAPSFSFGSATPAQSGGGMGGFGSSQPPSSGFGGGFGGSGNPSTPNMGMNQAPQFNIGSSGKTSTGPRRRLIRAKRPGSATRQA